MTDKFIIGLVGAPFGVKGFVKVHPCSGENDHLLKLTSVIVSHDGKNAEDSYERLLQIEESSVCASAKASVLMRFAGIDSPEAAKTLNGAKLLASREQASPLGEGEYYIEDLKGLPVMASAGDTGESAATGRHREIIGHITDIIEGGGGELAEIRLNNSEIKLVPFRKEFFPEISPQGGPEKGRVILQNLWILE